MGFLCTPARAQPDSLTHRFRNAHQAYAQGQYARAVDLYQRLLNSDRESKALYYNLGNAYARLEEWGEAIRYYEKARQLRPSDARVEHSLEQVRRRAGVYVPGRTPPQGLGGIVRDWSPLAIFWGGWALLVVGLAAAWGWGRSSVWKALRSPSVWGPITAGLLSMAVAFGVAFVQSQDYRAVVIADQAPLHATPTTEAVSDTTLPEGALLEVRSRRAQWTEVRLHDGTTGWISSKALGDV
jgi:tetratricopeptide (TPR) repeat protein